MVKKIKQLQQLEKVARIKADLELRKFAAFNAHVTAARANIASLEAALQQSYRATAPLAVSEARMANAQAGRAAREIRKATADLERMMPRFEAARATASREFGRAEALYNLAAAAMRHKPRE
ncbi:MAG: hypothetical protein Q4G49_03645 [Paracoccus sp. (in: a-proteobacteria)]|nr:hypothetical protein [Paracoccus sp. (in: a-proteobacteria)]